MALPRVVIVNRSYASSPTCAKLTKEADLMLPRFWLICDAFGCFEYSLKKLLGDVFPLDYGWQASMTTEIVDQMLCAYIKIGLLEVWVMPDTRKYGYFIGWFEHNRFRKDYARQTPVPPSLVETEYDIGVSKKAPYGSKRVSAISGRHIAANLSRAGGQLTNQPQTSVSTLMHNPFPPLADKSLQTADNSPTSGGELSLYLLLLPLTFYLLPSPSPSEGSDDDGKNLLLKGELEELTTNDICKLLEIVARQITEDPYVFAKTNYKYIAELKLRSISNSLIILVWDWYCGTRNDSSQIIPFYFNQQWNNWHAMYERKEK